MPELAMTLGRSLMLASTVRLPPTLTAAFGADGGSGDVVFRVDGHRGGRLEAAGVWPLAGPLAGVLLLAVC